MQVRELQRVRYRAGYSVAVEEWEHPGLPAVRVRRAYANDGGYIGDSAVAHRVCVVNRIVPERAAPEAAGARVGKRHDGRWCTWTADGRTVIAYRKGDQVQKGSLLEGALGEGFTAKTTADARQMAVSMAGLLDSAKG